MCWHCRCDAASRNKRLKARLYAEAAPLDLQPFADQSRDAMFLARAFFPDWTPS